MSSRPSAFTLTRPGPLRLFSTTELIAMPPPEWLIEPLIPAGGLVVLYGPPGCGKSFVAIDIALAVATGTSWQGRPTNSGEVLYVGAEGGAGISKRVNAWLYHYGIQPSHVNMAWLMEAIQVEAASEAMDMLLDRVMVEAGQTPTLIVLDTLARCFDGDENQQVDMGRFVAGVDRLRRECQATVVVVHHTRLDGERERGNTALRGGADAMIAASKRKGGFIALSCSKQKDAEEFEEITLRLKPIERYQSCVVNAVASDSHQSDMLGILERCGALSWDEFKSQAQVLGISKATFNRDLVRLKETCKIIKKNGKYDKV